MAAGRAALRKEGGEGGGAEPGPKQRQRWRQRRRRQRGSGDYGNDIRQKGNLNGFLEFKMDHKAAETTCSINNTFGPGTASECTVQHDSRSFAKEMRVWKVRSIVAGHWKLITTN
ncbi:PREDICTED: uncharacterized protein LOC108637964 [Capra hircus]|uniref:uncharacterized protein LOC108637964 n=1 Tax=Capra hircus TaxID=9925 RepID=UPI000846FA11|nr:PREDICTED: uncharacterized protein LOC108637964 [Capra hircus]